MTLRVAFVVANLVLLGVFVQQSLSSSFSPSDSHRALGEAAGYVPDGVTVFDDIPAVTKLEPALRAAVRKAATAAGDEGIVFYVNSGWRSREYQAQLLKDAIAQYGSEKEAARWVATPDTSPHVSGRRDRHRTLRRRHLAVQARRQVRAVPDLRQRALALRTAPGRRRTRLSAAVRRPGARPEDAGYRKVSCSRLIKNLIRTGNPGTP